MIRTLLTIFFGLAITLALSNSSIWAQGEHEGHGHQHKTSEVNIIGNVVGEESDKLKIQCPVMKTWFVLDKKTSRAVYKNKTYFFCCAGCKPQFLKEPEKYISEPSKPEAKKG